MIGLITSNADEPIPAVIKRAGSAMFKSWADRRQDLRATLLCVTLLACGCTPRPAAEPEVRGVAPIPVLPAHVADSRWIVERIDGARVLDSTEVTLVIGRGGIGGFDGCNQFGGSFVESASFRITDIAATAVGCAVPVLAQTRRLDDALTQVTTGERSARALALKDQAGRQRLLLTPETDFGPQAAKVAGTRWRMTRADGRPVTGDPITLAFGRSTFVIDVGCGQQTGAYLVQRDRIAFPRRDMDIRRCPGGVHGRGVPADTFAPLEAMETARRARVEGDALVLIGTNHHSVAFERCTACVTARHSMRVARWTPSGAAGSRVLSGRLAVRDQCIGIETSGRWTPVALPDPGMYWNDDARRLVDGTSRFALGQRVRVTGAAMATDGTVEPQTGLYPEDCAEGSLFLVSTVR